MSVACVCVDFSLKEFDSFKSRTDQVISENLWNHVGYFDNAWTYSLWYPAPITKSWLSINYHVNKRNDTHWPILWNSNKSGCDFINSSANSFDLCEANFAKTWATTTSGCCDCCNCPLCRMIVCRVTWIPLCVDLGWPCHRACAWWVSYTSYHVLTQPESMHIC